MNLIKSKKKIIVMFLLLLLTAFSNLLVPNVAFAEVAFSEHEMQVGKTANIQASLTWSSETIPQNWEFKVDLSNLKYDKNILSVTPSGPFYMDEMVYNGTFVNFGYYNLAIVALKEGDSSITFTVSCDDQFVDYDFLIHVKGDSGTPSTSTPTPTKKATSTPTPTKKATSTPTPTSKATSTPVPTKKATSTPVPTNKATSTPVPTKKATNTPVPTQKATNTPVPTNTPTTAVTPTSIHTIAPTTADTSSKPGDIVVTYYGGLLVDGTTTNVRAGSEMLVTAFPVDNLRKLTCRWGTDEPRVTQNASLRVKIPDAAIPGTIYVLTVEAEFEGFDKAGTETYRFKIVDDSQTNTSTLAMEPWMAENEELGELSIALRSDSEAENKANKNIYQLDDLITYYIDYKNGGKQINDEVTVQLEMPLNYKVVSVPDGKVSGGRIKWVFPNGLEEEEEGTLTAKVKITSLDSPRDVANVAYPTAYIFVDDDIQDISSNINYLIAAFDERLIEEHKPYMRGDANSDTFRPDYLITRAEGAIVLARIFGLEDQYRALTSNDITKKYADLNETYLEAQQAVTVATNAGLIQGYLEDDGTYTYRPNNKMTKAEFIKILAVMIQNRASEEGVKGLEIKPLNKLVKIYQDEKNYYTVGGQRVSLHWAIKEISYMARLNMLPFLTKDTASFNLDEGISRAELTQLVNAYLNRAPVYTESSDDTGFSDVKPNHFLVGDIIEATRKNHMLYIRTEDGKEEVR